MNFAVFASGNGSNLQAIINAVKRKGIKANLTLVFSDKAESFALKRTAKAKIEALHLNPNNFPNRMSFDAAILKQLKVHAIDFIVLAGYMRLLSSVLIDAYPNKILNIHPSLLPAFKGAHGIRDAFEYGAKVVGATVHFVVEEIDAGAIILQESVAVTSKDTLLSVETKIHKIEHRILPQAIDLFARGKLKLQGRKIIIAR